MHIHRSEDIDRQRWERSRDPIEQGGKRRRRPGALLCSARIMSQRDGQRLHPQILASADASIASANKRKGSPCQQDDDSFARENGDGDSQSCETIIHPIPDLPEDIWHHIHSLMLLRDAARAACLSHAFLRFWRCYPNLTFSVYESRRTINSIIRNHSGIGVKILKLRSIISSDRKLNRWLRIAVKPGIEELTLKLRYIFGKKYKFPCSLFSDGVRNSIRRLELAYCAFCPTAKLGPLRSLTSLHLSYVHITGDELECFLSNSLALEELELDSCLGIICLRIPCELQRFSRLRIIASGLKLIESKAPNLSTLDLWGKPKLSLGEAVQMKTLSMHHSNFFCYARTELPSIMPNLDTLKLSSSDEVVNAPMLPTKFLCLKRLTICLYLGPFPASFDYFSLVSFLDASPYLETLSLDAKEPMKQESIFRGSKRLRQMDEDQHCYLKNVKITGFSSSKSLVELVCYILKNAVSLECLTLDTLRVSSWRCSDQRSGRCYIGNDALKILKEARRALGAIRTYVKDKVPARVKLTILEPCSLCHKF